MVVVRRAVLLDPVELRHCAAASEEEEEYPLCADRQKDWGQNWMREGR
jgi:hypothetical protein